MIAHRNLADSAPSATNEPPPYIPHGAAYFVEQSQLLTSADVCAILRISRRTLGRYVARKLITQIAFNARTVRYSRTDIKRFELRGRNRG